MSEDTRRNGDPLAPVMLVGEAPWKGSAPEDCYPLFFWPPGCAGHRLFCLTGWSRGEYLWGTYRVNLIEDYVPRLWPHRLARERAKKLLSDRLADTSIVAFSSKVMGSFYDASEILIRQVEARGTWRVEWFSWYELTGDCRIMFMPHPSGRNLMWNDERNIRRANEIFAELRPLVQKHLLSDGQVVTSAS